MPIFNNILAGSSGQSTGYDIDQSLRFNKSDSAYLYRTNTAGNRRVATWSFWVKPGEIGATNRYVFSVVDGSDEFGIYFPSNDCLEIYFYPGSYTMRLVSSQVFRDPSAWYHCVISMDTEQGTASNRVKLYVNGSQVTSFSTETYMAEDSDTSVNKVSLEHRIGRYTTNYFPGYLAEVHFIDGTALDASSFGETDAATNQWKPIQATGLTYGTNGFYQSYSVTELANSFIDSALGALKLSTQTAAMWTNSGMAVFSASIWADPGSGTSAVLSDTTGAGSAIGSTLTCDFGSGNEKRLGKLEVYFQNTNIYCTWKMQYSADDISWTDVSNPSPSTLGGTPGAAGTLSMTWDVPTTAYRYWRLYKTNSPTSGSWQEWNKLYEWDDNEPKHTITANGDVANSRAQYKIGTSSIKFDGTDDYLSIPDSSDWTFGTGDFCIETWVNGNADAGEIIFGQRESSSIRWYVMYDLWADSIAIYHHASSIDIETATLSIATDEWNHVAISRSSGVIKIFLNGVSQTLSTNDNPAANFTDVSAILTIGKQITDGNDLNGYMDEIRISDTARYTSNFTPSTTEFVSDSNTMLLIHSDFDGGLGADSSGNKNDFSATNLVATDQMIDTPTNNFCTLNPLAMTITGLGASSTLKEGNLTLSPTGQTAVNGTMFVSQGKWYWEYTPSYILDASWPLSGLVLDTAAVPGTGDAPAGQEAGSWAYLADGRWRYEGTYGSTYTATVAGQAVQFALDMDAGKLWVGVNGTWVTGDPTTGASPIQTGIVGNVGPSIGSVGPTGTPLDSINFGQESFAHTPPAGYKSLCTDNLSDPAIADPTKHFNTVLRTATGTSGGSVTGVGFQPDMIWQKRRSATSSHYINDVIRGSSKILVPNDVAAESTDAQWLVSFDSDGYTIGNQDWASGGTVASWNWKAGGAAVTKTAGNIDGTNPTIASSVSANTTAGFSIVTFDGTGSSGTVEHGLSQAPDLIITKKRDDTSGNNQNWIVGSSALAAGKTLELNGASAVGTISAYDSTIASASVINYLSNDNTNQSGSNFVAYCFHSIEGYSKVGSFTGNGNADGPFIYTDMAPSFVMFKNAGAAENWRIIDNKRDPYNVRDRRLMPNSSSEEIGPPSAVGQASVDFLSNGFKLRTTNGAQNQNATSIIYIAFAESPFKYSNAR